MRGQVTDNQYVWVGWRLFVRGMEREGGRGGWGRVGGWRAVSANVNDHMLAPMLRLNLICFCPQKKEKKSEKKKAKEEDSDE